MQRARMLTAVPDPVLEIITEEETLDRIMVGICREDSNKTMNTNREVSIQIKLVSCILMMG